MKIKNKTTFDNLDRTLREEKHKTKDKIVVKKREQPI